MCHVDVAYFPVRQLSKYVLATALGPPKYKSAKGGNREMDQFYMTSKARKENNWLTLVDMFYSCNENVQIPRCHLLYYISIWAPKAYSIWRNQSKLAAVLSPHCSLRSIRSLNLNLNEHSEGCCLGNCTFRKLPLVGCKFGKFHFAIKYHILDSVDLIV